MALGAAVTDPEPQTNNNLQEVKGNESDQEVGKPSGKSSNDAQFLCSPDNYYDIVT